PNAQQAALVGVPVMSKDDFEKQYGYGIATLYEQRRKQAVAGPNQAIRDSLGEADRKAYDHALYGDDPTATFAEAVDSGDYSRLGGCIKTATDQVFGAAGPDYDHAALTALQREEVAMVAADKKCEESRVQSVEAKVTGEYETAFREQNAALLAKVPKR